MIKIFFNKVRGKLRYLFNKYKKNMIYWIKYWKWRCHIKFGRIIHLSNEMPKATVIINSFNRVKNIDPMIRAALKCNFVDKVIVSNNNPQIKIENWVTVESNRLILIKHKFRKRCRFRWIVAAKNPCRFFIAIDDDIFFYPEQLKKLFESLLEDPSVPHGMFGSIYNFKDTANDWNSSGYAYFKGRNMPVDVLHQIYAVTNDHVSNYFKLLTNTRIHNNGVSKKLKKIGDDVVISHAGYDRPQIHDFGTVLECPSHEGEAFATWRRPGFYQKRYKIFREVRKAVYRLHWSNNTDSKSRVKKEQIPSMI